MAKTKKSSSTKKDAGRMPKAHVPLTPLGDRVLIKPLSQEEMGSTTSFGLIIPDTAKEKPEQGRVVAVGAGKWDEDGERRIPLSVAVGDKVMFSKYGYDEVKVDGTTYLIVSETNILAILN